MPAHEWRKGLGGVVTVKDLRAPNRFEPCFELGNGLFGPCSSMPAATPSASQQPPLGELRSIASCAVQSIPTLPTTGFHAKIDVVVSPAGITASMLSGSPVLAGWQACADDAAQQYRRLDAAPGTIEVSIHLEYTGWCDVLPTGERPLGASSPVVVSDSKATRLFALHKAAFGYWLLSCEGPESWQVRLSGSAVEVLAPSGTVQSVGRWSADGFSITSAAGEEVLSGAGPRERLSLSASGQSLGELTCSAADGGNAAAKLVSRRETLVVDGSDGRWIASIGTMREAELSGGEGPDSLLLLVLPNVGLVHRTAAFALLAANRQ